MSEKTPANLDDIDFGATMRGHQSGDLAFGRFALKRVLGRGGMGVVWLAEDTRLSREVALKFAPETLRSDDAAIEELKGETVRGQDLSHPNIVRIYDFFLDDQHAAICMEYVDGDTLAKLRVRQANKVFEPHQVTRWVSQILDGLSYAHRSARIAHRDLKPPNLIINSKGDLKIMDFGIARSIQDSLTRVTIAGNSTGTLAYMSPQQASGKSASITDDIYSLGSTLYELFTGKPPFHTGDLSRQIREETPLSIVERRLEFGLTNTQPFPPEWEETIRRCLEKNPELRPADAEEVRALLGLGGAAPAPSLSPSALGDPSLPTGAVASFDTAPSAARSVTVRASSALSPLQMDTAVPPRVTVASVTDVTKPQGVEPKSKSILPWVLVGAAVVVLGGSGALFWPKISTLLSRPPSTVPTPEIVQTIPDPLPTETKPKPSQPTVEPTMPTKPPAGLVVPDGYPTIQAALAAAKTGETVKLKAGTYEETVRLVDGVSLAAEAGARVLISVDGKLGNAMEADKLKTQLKISGITFTHGDGDLSPGSSGAAVVSILSSRVTFEDCLFESGLGSGVQVEGSSRVTFTRCTAQRNLAAGFQVGRGASVLLENCKALGNGTDGLLVTGRATTAEVKGLECLRNQQNGTAVQEAALLKAERLNASENVLNGLYVMGQDSRAEVKEGRFNKNGFVFAGGASKGTESGTGGGGVVAESAAIAQIEGGEVNENAKYGVQFLDCGPGSLARGAKFIGNAHSNIIALGSAGQSVLIEGNQCVKGGRHGIAIDGLDFSPQVLRNHCAFNSTAILIASGAKPVMEGNSFEGNTKETDVLLP